MSKSYKRQILDYNIKKFSLIVRADINLFSSTKILTQANKNAALQVNSMSGAKKIKEKLKWYIKKNNWLRNYWCLAKTAVDKAGVLGFIDALVVFIK